MSLQPIINQTNNETGEACPRCNLHVMPTRNKHHLTWCNENNWRIVNQRRLSRKRAIEYRTHQ